MSQLSDLLASSTSQTIEVGGKSFAVTNFVQNDELELDMANFRAVRATYNGMKLPKCRVVGRAGAEVWEVFGSAGRTVAKFAVHNGQVIALA